ncbi:MAG: hypothetical protein JXA51_00235 [Dehalococcoidales bacterium]|nr:hypothetical protein [Dehalococcoidales bacterium]
MSKNNDFDNILNECLERLISGETVEACLSSYHEHADELEPLLRTITDAREAAAIEPRPDFRERASRDFQAAIRDMEPARGQGFFAVFPRWATVVTAVVIVLLAATGTAYASLGSLPEESLYQVKLATESVRLAFTPSDMGKAELYAEFADERVNEIIRMADKGKIEQVEEATERMNDQLIAMASLVSTVEKGEAQMQIATYEAAEPAPAMAPVPAPSPEPEPAPMPAPVQEEAPAPVIETPPKAADEPVTLSAPRANGDLGETFEGLENLWAYEAAAVGEQSELMKTVLDQARQNIRELEELLQRVSESQRGAVQHALDVAVIRYTEILRNLE